MIICSVAPVLYVSACDDIAVGTTDRSNIQALVTEAADIARVAVIFICIEPDGNKSTFIVSLSLG